MVILNIRRITTLWVVSLFAFAASPVHAGLVQVASPTGLPTINDSIDWATLGGDFTPLTPPVPLLSTGGHSATLSGSTAFTLFSGSTYNADFLPGDIVVSAFDLNTFTALGTGIRIDLAFLVYGIGAQVQVDSFGPFHATMQALDANSVSLGTVSIDSSVGGNGDGSAAFLGAFSTGNPIASVIFTSDGTGLAIDQVALDTVPEPTTFCLAFSAIAALAVVRRKRG
jgi:hypothetical protein